MIRTGNRGRNGWFCCMRGTGPGKKSSAFSYKKFIDFALEEIKGHTSLVPSPLQEKFNSLKGNDGRSELEMLSFEAPKVRLLRCLSIEGDGMQVLDLAVFPRPEFDLPIFCANFFTAANTNIVVLDLNPLHCVITGNDYKEKYYRDLIPLGLKYAELLPWGGKLTSESLRFFSPIVIWTKFSPSQNKYSTLFAAFKDYYKAWLKLIDQAAEETDASQIVRNREAQHKYLMWRAEKDPGRQLLRKLVGEAFAEEIVRSFLFNGVHELGNKTFLDYYPEYKSEDGSINQKRSIIGKSFEDRPWDSEGNFLITVLGRE
ncbi:OLC1v1012157C4 [Oldenlandia corymbosa var. corymbosa]|nr:OLC1v1012157C4 [Oldenlandia corymbosa var. corymbosa]